MKNSMILLILIMYTFNTNADEYKYTKNDCSNIEKLSKVYYDQFFLMLNEPEKYITDEMSDEDKKELGLKFLFEGPDAATNHFLNKYNIQIKLFSAFNTAYHAFCHDK